MGVLRAKELDPGYLSEIDTTGNDGWHEAFRQFDDANIYQSWPYAAVISGPNTSRLILRKDGKIVAMAQARLAELPLIKAGFAYVPWGPLWRSNGIEDSPDTFRQAIRALRNEFVCNRGFTLRLAPLLFSDALPCFLTILAEEGFESVELERRQTILMDLRPPIGDIYEGMRPHWKRELRLAGRRGLEIVEGTEDSLFSTFIDIYREMVSRKHFLEPNDITQFRCIQSHLPAQLKMKIMLCTLGGQVCAGLICSALGKSAIYLFGATSNAGMKSGGSYLLHWKLIEELKRIGTPIYNLNGINPTKNPGTYKFKKDLAGKNGEDVYLLGRFDAHGSAKSRLCVQGVDAFRSCRRRLLETCGNGLSSLGLPRARGQVQRYSIR